MAALPEPIAKLLQLQQSLCDEYEAENKALRELVEEKEETIRLLEETIRLQKKLIEEKKKQ